MRALFVLFLLSLPATGTAQLRILDGPINDQILVLVDAPEANSRVHGCRAGHITWQDADGLVRLPIPPACDAQLFPLADRLLVNHIDRRLQIVDARTGIPEVEWAGVTDGRVSPDGGSVVFIRAQARPSGLVGDAPVQVVIAEADGTSERTVITAPLLFSPVWTPDGQGLFVMGGPEHARIHRLGLDGTLTVLRGHPPIPEEYPVWADSRTWVYEARGHVWELDLDSARILSLHKVGRADRGPRLRGTGGVQRFVVWPEPEGPKIVLLKTLRGTAR
ncbi:MAG: hypothetical protein ACI9WU_001556 [Myxococcota bacterium]|jgi:hypothetical protein